MESCAEYFPTGSDEDVEVESAVPARLSKRQKPVTSLG